MRRALLVAGLVAACAAPSVEAAAPKIRQLVVFRDGSALSKTVSTRATQVRVGSRRCAAGSATALAALVRSRPGALRLRDFGSCSTQARDGGGLFVRAIRGEANRGQDGWVYKVGRKVATAGAADPSGPFGRGRLRSGQRVTWFYGRMRGGSFQRTLELTAKRSGAGTLVVRVRGYDDDGRGVAVEGADVISRAGQTVTGADGTAVLSVPPGSYVLRAHKRGLVSSFGVRATVR